MITKDKTTITYKGDGVTTSFPFPYQYRAGEDIKGYLLVNNKEMPIIANYRFDEVENKFIYPANGVPLFTTDTLVIKRETPIEQNADLPNKYPYNAVETVADNLTLIAQEQETKIKGIENIRDELNEIAKRTVSMNFPEIKNMLDVRAINADSDSLEDILRAIVKEVTPDGKAPDISPISIELKKKGYWNDGTLINVLSILIKNAITPKTPTALAYIEPKKGNTVLKVSGESHYKVDANGENLTEIINGSADLSIPSYDKADIIVNYYNMVGDKVSTITIQGIKGQSFTDKNGITVSKEGTVLTVDLTNQTPGINSRYDISDRPSWASDNVTEYKFMSNSPNKIIGYNELKNVSIEGIYQILSGLKGGMINAVYFNVPERKSVIAQHNILYGVINNGEKVVSIRGKQLIRIAVGPGDEKASLIDLHQYDDRITSTTPVVLDKCFGEYYKVADDL
nr:MAG TPA: tail fiber protein [Caudoviricetes sp.]